MGHAPLMFWKAWEHPDLEQRRQDDFDRSKRTLIVAGKAKVKAATTPMLEEDVGRSDEPKTLYLRFRTLEIGESWKPVWFQKEIKSGDYDKVQLRIPEGDVATGDGFEILQCLNGVWTPIAS